MLQGFSGEREMVMPWQWIHRLFARPARTAAARPTRRAGDSFVPRFDQLESREVPTVSIQRGIPGLLANSIPGQAFQPPDTNLAVGPSQIVEAVNLAGIIDTKNGVRIATVDFNVMFPPLSLFRQLSDPQIAYDEGSQRFIFAIIEVDFIALTSWLRIAVSNSSTVNNWTTDWTERQDINLLQLDTTAPFNGLLWGDYPRLGYNSDAICVTFNMFGFVTGQYDHTNLVTIRKSTILDRKIPTLQVATFARDDVDFTMVPARMHDTAPNGPMYFLSTLGLFPFTQDASSYALRFTTMTNVITANPGFQVTNVSVPYYGNGIVPDTVQPGDGSTIFPQLTVGILDTRMLSVAWRANHLVACQTANIAGEATVRWYELDTSTPIPKLLQASSVDGGPGVYTYNPAIEIAKNMDIGMTYQQNSQVEFPAMYVTGRTPKDAAGLMQPPVRVRQGEVSLVNGPGRTGDFAGMAVDPLYPNQFWAAHEYGSQDVPPPLQPWGTFMAAFTVSPLLPSIVKTYSPTRFTFDARTNSFTGIITIYNPTPTLTGRLVLQVTVNDPSITLINPGATRFRNTYSILIPGALVRNAPLQIPIALRNPLHHPMGTTLIGVAFAVV